MNHTELGITHVLHVSPRGFNNETQTLPVTLEYLPLAEATYDRLNNDVDAWAYLTPWEETSAHLRSRVGLLLRELDSQQQFEAFMMDAFHVEDADCRGGQWHPSTEDQQP